MEHTHPEHSPKGHVTIYTKVWLLSLSIVSFELVGSVLSGSHALLADIGHVISDTVLALIPLTALLLLRFKVSYRLVAFISSIVAGVFLAWIGLHVASEAWMGLMGDEHHEHEVNGWLLFLFSGLAALMNLFQHRLLSRVSPDYHHGAHKGLHFHVLMDLVKNIALPVLGLGIALHLLPDSADLWAALAIGALLIVRAIALLATTVFAKERPPLRHGH